MKDFYLLRPARRRTPRSQTLLQSRFRKEHFTEKKPKTCWTSTTFTEVPPQLVLHGSYSSYTLNQKTDTEISPHIKKTWQHFLAVCSVSGVARDAPWPFFFFFNSIGNYLNVCYSRSFTSVWFGRQRTQSMKRGLCLVWRTVCSATEATENHRLSCRKDAPTDQDQYLRWRTHSCWSPRTPRLLTCRWTCVSSASCGGALTQTLWLR